MESIPWVRCASGNVFQEMCEEEPYIQRKPEDTEVDERHDKDVESSEQDVEQPGGVVGGQVDIGAGVQEVGVVLPRLDRQHYCLNICSYFFLTNTDWMCFHIVSVS